MAAFAIRSNAASYEKVAMYCKIRRHAPIAQFLPCLLYTVVEGLTLDEAQDTSQILASKPLRFEQSMQFSFKSSSHV